MNVPPLTRFAERLSYDRAKHTLRVKSVDSDQIFTNDEQIADALQTHALDRWVAPYITGYGLALVAGAWAARPSEARRGAIIQAHERLSAAGQRYTQLAALLDDALRGADRATLLGDDAEAAVIAVVTAVIARVDRVAERCGRIASGLLDDADRILAPGDAGPALVWLLATAEQDGKQVTVVDLGDASYSVVFLGAERIALDGSVLAARGSAQVVAEARAKAIPRYVLGYDTVFSNAQTGVELAHGADWDVVAPNDISSIVTHRGIYRPEMIARHLGDGEAPLDVIPLN